MSTGELPFEFTSLGMAITYDTPGLPDNLAPLVEGRSIPGKGFIADPTSLLLPDGRIRLYFEGDGGRTFVTTRPVTPPYTDIEFRVDAPYLLADVEGNRVEGLVWRRIFPLEDGRFRMFARSPLALYSFISDDALTFVQELGVRLTPQDFGFDRFNGFQVSLGAYDIVETESGYRLYVDLDLGPTEKGGTFPTNDEQDRFNPGLVSAFSTDMLNWVVEKGNRFDDSWAEGLFDPRPDGSVPPWPKDFHDVIRREDGSYVVFTPFFDNGCARISEDGLTFGGPPIWLDSTRYGSAGQDKLQMPDGSYMVFATASQIGIPMGHLRID